MAVSLRKFEMPIDPNEILQGTYGEWVLLILFCGLFIAVALATLPKHMTSGRGKAVATFIGLIMGIGLFTARKILNFNLESLGFIGIMIIVIIVGLAFYGIFKTSKHKSIAIAATICITYLSFRMISPSVLDTFAEAFPLMNLILIGAFFYLLGFIIFKAFPRRDKLSAAEDVIKEDTPTTEEDNPQINKELRDETKETKLIKRKTMRLTNTEIKSISDLEQILHEMINLIREKGNSIDQHETAELTQALREISQKEQFMKSGLDTMHRHVAAYKTLHRKDIHELNDRLQKTKDKKKRQTIEEEIRYQNRMLEVLAFLDRFEQRIQQFAQDFNNTLYTAMWKIKNQSPNEALAGLDHARQSLAKMKHIFEKQKDLEKYLLKLNKKTIKDLKKEKRQK